MKANEIDVRKCYVGAPHEKTLFVVRCTKVEEYGGTRQKPHYEFYGTMLMFAYNSYSKFDKSKFEPEWLLEEVPEDTFYKIMYAGGDKACLLIKELYDAAKMREAMNETDMDVRHYTCD